MQSRTNRTLFNTTEQKTNTRDRVYACERTEFHGSNEHRGARIEITLNIRYANVKSTYA